MSEFIPVNYVAVPTARPEFQHGRTYIDAPQKVDGVGKLGVRLLGVLLRDRRDNVGTVTNLGGTLLPEVIDTGAQSISSLRALAAIALADAVSQIKSADSRGEAQPPEEQLSSASIVSVSYVDSQDHIDITIQVVPVSGAATQLTIPRGN